MINFLAALASASVLIDDGKLMDKLDAVFEDYSDTDLSNDLDALKKREEMLFEVEEETLQEIEAPPIIDPDSELKKFD